MRRTPAPSASTAQHDPAEVAAQLRLLALKGSPVDLPSIAAALDAEVRYDPAMDRIGHTSWHAGRPSIALQPDQDLRRKRFTLAHELAHVYLGHGRGSEDSVEVPGQRPQRANFREEERLADAIAGSLLVPLPELQRLKDQDDLSIAEVRATASRLEVSNSVLVRSLAEYDRTRHWLLVMLRRMPQGHWLLWRLTGRIRGLNGAMDLAPTEFTRLDALSDHDCRMHIRVTVGGREFTMEGTGNRWNDRTLLLVDHVRRAGC